MPQNEKIEGVIASGDDVPAEAVESASRAPLGHLVIG